MQPQTSHSSGLATGNVDWARLLELLQNAQTRYPSSNPHDSDDSSSESDSSSAAEISPERPSSPGERPTSSAAPLTSSAAPELHHYRIRLPHTYRHYRNHRPPLQHRAQLMVPDGSLRGPASLSQPSRRPQTAGAAAGAGGSGPHALNAPPVDPDATVSASAERHRLASATTSISLPTLADWVADIVPFALLLLWVFIVKHFSVLLLAALLSGSLLQANTDMRRTLATRPTTAAATAAAAAAATTAAATSASTSTSSWRAAAAAALGNAHAGGGSGLAAVVAETAAAVFGSGGLARQALRVAAVTAIALLFSLSEEPRVLRVLSLRLVPTASALDALLLVLVCDALLRLAAMLPKLAVVAWFRLSCSYRPWGGVWGSGGSGSGSGCRLPVAIRPVGAAAGGAGCCGITSSWCARFLWTGGGLWARGGCGGGGSGGSSAAFQGGGGGGAAAAARVQRQQSRVLSAVECGLAVYRAVLPAPVWYGYLLNGSGFSPVLASLFCGFYLALKAPHCVTQVKLLVLALRVAMRQSALYGSYVGRDSGAAEGGSFGACPICQDPVACAVRLDCGHVYCEECIVEWLERDRTCPMCRATVRPAGLPACSDGASPLLPQVF